MSHRTIIFLTLFLALIVASLHLGALEYYWYWTYWWFDILLHFLSGVLIGFLFLSLFESHIHKEIFEKHMFLLIILFVFMVGFGWEVFEVIIQPDIVVESDYVLDTFSDILVDFSGGLFAYISLSRLLVCNKKDTNV